MTREAIPVIALFNIPPMIGISPIPPSISPAISSSAFMVSLENKSLEIKVQTTSTKSRAMVIITESPSIPRTRASNPPTAVPKPAVEPRLAPAAPLKRPPKPADRMDIMAFIPTPTMVNIITSFKIAGADFCSRPAP